MAKRTLASPSKTKSKAKVKSKAKAKPEPKSQPEARQAAAAKPETASPRVLGFNIDAPKLPPAIEDAALASGGYPYDKKLKRSIYETELRLLQIELRKLQASIEKDKRRLVCLFEGRDAAGKGSTISRFMAHLNPRMAKVVALQKPTETERGQWYFQRYVAHLPAAGNITLFDRSWYNRAGVERVMGFCGPDQLADFLREAPQFEGLLARDDMHVFKFYLDIGREMQLKRFHARRHDPLKQWKITDIDIAAIDKWDDYTRAKEDMFRFTHTSSAPWTVIRANDKRRTRLEAMRVVLSALDYDGKDRAIVRTPDPLIVGSGPAFFFGPQPVK
jgi:polyphosphate kinase